MAVDSNGITLDRRARVLQLIETKGQVKVNELRKMFGVSEVTIRNDLAQLEEKGLLVRARGGAFRAQRVAADFALNIKAKKHHKQKQAIGRRAADLIEEGDTIIIDSGTTTMEVARNLARFQNLTVITNALNIAGELVGHPQIKVIIPGGFLRENSLSLVGPIAESSIRNYYCDKLIIGVDGVDSQYGISTPNVEEAHLNRIMIDISREVIVVTDSSKFLRRSFAFIAPIEKIHTVITASDIPEEEHQRLLKAGVRVEIAYKLNG